MWLPECASGRWALFSEPKGFFKRSHRFTGIHPLLDGKWLLTHLSFFTEEAHKNLMNHKKISHKKVGWMSHQRGPEKCWFRAILLEEKSHDSPYETIYNPEVCHLPVTIFAPTAFATNSPFKNLMNSQNAHGVSVICKRTQLSHLNRSSFPPALGRYQARRFSRTCRPTRSWMLKSNSNSAT